MPRVVVVGSCNLDLITTVPSLPQPGETVLGADVLTRPGGKGANQAVAAHRLGARTTFVSATGDDRFATAIRASLEGEGLDLAHVASLPGASGVALIVVDAASENMIAVASGANRRLGPDHVTAVISDLTADDVLLMQLETPVASGLAAAQAARVCGARVIVNAAPIPADLDPQLLQLIGLTDVLIVNQGEAQALARDTDDDWGRLASRLCELGPRSVVITLGAEGAVIADDQDAHRVVGHEVEVVDTTGAGDAFCGAFAAALADGQTPHDAVGYGCLVGALATTAVGAQAALPTADQVRAMQ